jgi:hypothetical protein
MARYESLTEGRSPTLLALLTVVLGGIAAVILIALGFVFIGFVVALAALPAALVVWMTAG